MNKEVSSAVARELVEARAALQRAATPADVARVVWEVSGLLDHREDKGEVCIFAHRLFGGTGHTLRRVPKGEYNAALLALCTE